MLACKIDQFPGYPTTAVAVSFLYRNSTSSRSITQRPPITKQLSCKVDQFPGYPTAAVVVSFLYRNATSSRSMPQRPGMTKQLSWHDAFDCHRLPLANTPLNFLTSYVRIPKCLHKLCIPSKGYISFGRDAVTTGHHGTGFNSSEFQGMFSAGSSNHRTPQ